MAFLIPRLRFTILGALLATAAGVAQGSTRFSVTPSDTVAAEGHPVVLYCSVADLNRKQVYWNVQQRAEDGTVTADFTLGPYYNAHGSYPRLQFVGDPSVGGYNLRLEEARPSDAGTYTCLVSDLSNPNDVAMEAGARLTVVDAASAPASGPECSSDVDGEEAYEEGDMVTLSCASPLGVPPPQLAWERVSASNSTQVLASQTTSVADGAVTVTARLTLSSLDHLSSFRCSQRHPVSDQVRSCRLPPLEVRFRPSVELHPKVVSAEPLATRTVELRCVALANPPLAGKPQIVLPFNKTHRVTYDGPDPSKTAVEVEITTDDVGRDFYCLASNEMGVGRDTLEVLRLSAVPPWLVMTIIGGVSFVLLILMVICCCVFCVDRKEPDPEDKVTISQWQRRQSRAATARRRREKAEAELDNNDAFQEDMVPIEDFQGGRESMDVDGAQKSFDSDFETGEKGTGYQNVNEAFQSDSNNSYTQSNPSSSEPILDTDFD